MFLFGVCVAHVRSSHQISQKRQNLPPHLVRESFRTPNGPRSRTICNISKLPPEVRHLITSALSGKPTLQADSIELDSALDFGGLAVLVDAWKSLNLDLLLADIGTPRQRALLKAIVLARIFLPCSKLALKDAAQGTLLPPPADFPTTKTSRKTTSTPPWTPSPVRAYREGCDLAIPVIDAGTFCFNPRSPLRGR